MSVFLASLIKYIGTILSRWPFILPVSLVVTYIFYKLTEERVTDVHSISDQLAMLPDNSYTVLNNISIKTPVGSYLVDSIVVSASGVFVISDQQYQGEIIGADTDQYWICLKGNQDQRFFNPIRQHFSLIKALEHVLRPVGHVPLIPIVAFSRDSTFESRPHGVIYYDELPDKIKSYTRNILTRTQTEVVASTLKRANNRNM